MWPKVLVVVLSALTLCVVAQNNNPITIIVGEDSNAKPSNVGWTDGVCYKPITSGVHTGDTLEFWYYSHDVYRMASREHFLNCDFTDAQLLSGVGEGTPYRYRIFDEDVNSTLYFACSIGSHCDNGNQKLQVKVTEEEEEEETEERRVEEPAAVSSYVIGSSEDCKKVQESPFDEELASEVFNTQQQQISSECSTPILGDDGYYRRTCLSGPATLTPGGVINRLFVLQYPFPKDHRVAIGQRTFEFVHDALDGSDDDDVVPVPVNQLYVHHLSGNVVFGQGTEGVRQEAPDAPFQGNYTLMSGDEGDSMTFHIIDLREVDDWLACIECRCQNDEGSYMESLLGNKGNLTGGVNCCTNCTSLTGPTLDYRMRYNISYRELDDVEPIQNIEFLLADISPAVGKNLEHDVYSWEYLPENEKNEAYPYVQYLERIEPFNVLFKEGFFERDYSGTSSSEIRLLRCVAHLHVAAIDMWLEDYETGQRLCDGQTTYGTDPNTDKDFLISVSVDNHDPPITFAPDRLVRMVTRYDATNLHTGVMGYWFVFIVGDDVLTRQQVNMTVDLSDCLQPMCDTTLLPQMDMDPFEQPSNTALLSTRQQQQSTTNDECMDTLKNHPACMFGGICDCDLFVNSPQSEGCDGYYNSPTGNIEVRSVCANYCGCEVTTIIEEAMEIEASCVDTLVESPSCTFGGLCDCETFVNAPESSGCDGIYASVMGDIVVQSVCAKYCGCGDGKETQQQQPEQQQQQQQPQPEDSSSMNSSGACTNTLSQNPICRFGQICECEEFVNAPESEGCGGTYLSDRGNIVINDVCAQYCNACGSLEELFEEAYMEVVRLRFRDKCHFATRECKSMLSNLYACGTGQPGIEEAHPMIQTVVLKNGQKIALENARLGNPSLHSSSEEQRRPEQICGVVVEEGNNDNDLGAMDTSSHTKKGKSILLMAATISGVLLLLL